MIVSCVFMSLMCLKSADEVSTTTFKESFRYDYVRFDEIPDFRTDIEHRIYDFNISNVGQARLEIFDSGGFNFTIVDYVKFGIQHLRMCKNREFKSKLFEETSDERNLRLYRTLAVDSDEGDLRGLMIRHTFHDHFKWDFCNDNTFLHSGDILIFRLSAIFHNFTMLKKQFQFHLT